MALTDGHHPPPPPPIARRIPKIDVVHGESRQDDYFWLRDKDNPEVIAHLNAENAHTDSIMGRTEALQKALYCEMLARIKEDDQSVPYRRGDYFYYSRTETGKQYPILCRKAGGLDGPEAITLDLNVLAEGRPFLSLGAYTVSDDGHRLAYSIDVTGFREYTLYIKDLRTGELAPDRIDRVTSVAWTADPAVLLYVLEDHAKRPYQLCRHRLGVPEDERLYEETDALFRLHVARSRSRAFVLATSASFTSTEVRYAPAAGASGPWRVIRPRETDHEYHVDHGGEFFYIRTNGDRRRNFRLVRTPVDDPHPERWTELLPHRDAVVLEDVDVFAGHLVVHERADGLVRLRVTDLSLQSAHDIDFPEPTYDVSAEPNPEFDTRRYRFRYQSLITPSSVFAYDVGTRTRTLLKQTAVLGGYNPARYRSERVSARAADGTPIAISLVFRTDQSRGGARPLLLTAYGAYGYPYPVTFSSNRLSLLDRGVTVAIAHVRGGGEGGKPWHDGGRMLAKRATFTDFIAAAEYLIDRGYTDRDWLVIEGGSAGGLLIGAVLNARGDLFRAAVLHVPFVDVINTMLDESLPLTIGEFEEWGNPTTREHYEYIRTYCPYTNIRAQPYPALLVRTSLNDSQVMYWEPAKYVAKLRATKTDDNPALLKVNMDAGHGGASGRYDALRELAFDYAFVLTELGLADGDSTPENATAQDSLRPASRL